RTVVAIHRHPVPLSLPTGFGALAKDTLGAHKRASQGDRMAPMTATLERPAPNALLAVQEQPLRVAIYLRMSTDKELGIDRQREDCLALCQRLGWIPVEYVD